jgi:hypothetical protein
VRALVVASAGQVLVRSRVTAVSAGTESRMLHGRGPQWPVVGAFGYLIAGDVVAVGPGVSGVAVGASRRCRCSRRSAARWSPSTRWPSGARSRPATAPSRSTARPRGRLGIASLCIWCVPISRAPAAFEVLRARPERRLGLAFAWDDAQVKRLADFAALS